jgi:hypothetical protein
MKAFGNFYTLLRYFQNQADSLAMKAELCSLHDLEPEWIFNHEAGDLRRPDQGFYSVGGVRAHKDYSQEAAAWKQPMLYNNQVGHVLLIMDDRHGQLLLRCMAEPGNPGYVHNGRNTRVLVAPSVQVSGTNRKLHGNRIPLSDLIDDASIKWQPAHADGGRFFKKTNKIGLLTTSKEQICKHVQENWPDMKERMFWASRGQLGEIFERGLGNQHLREVASLLV